jgi:FkbM family methyltransferase
MSVTVRVVAMRHFSTFARLVSTLARSAMVRMVEQHPHLRLVARGMYRLPGMRRAAGAAVRFLMQSVPLSRPNLCRLVNFFADELCGTSCVVRVPGTSRSVTLELDPQNGMDRYWSLGGYAGYYEPGTTRLFARLAREAACIFDAGAHVGYYSILAAALVEGRGSVHAFEPQARLAERLARNAAANQLGSLRVNACALATEEGTQPLFFPSTTGWDSAASLVPGYMEQAASVAVPTTTIAAYCRTQGVARIDLLKMDVEGSELAVLRGMGELLDAWRPDIICEVLSPYDAELEAFFSRLPYRKLRIEETRLVEVERLAAHPTFRDYYLTCKPQGLIPSSFSLW